MVAIPSVETTAADLRPNTRVRGTFLVRRKSRGVGKTGKAWLQLILGDKSGTVDARVWDNADSIDKHIQENDVVDVEGMGVTFMDNVQLKVGKLSLHEGDADPTDFLPGSARSDSDLRADLQAEVDAVQEPWIKTLLQAYLDDNDWFDQFVRAPAAKSIHHAWIGGLAEHTLSMMQLARVVGGHYSAQGVEPFNPDVLVAGAFLHDTGKIEELSVETGFGYTDAGRLIGHMQLGIDVLDRRVGALDGFPDDLHMHLRHLILSHHGEYEYGSPRRPKTIEAILLHFIDNMDARTSIFAQAIASPTASGNWTALQASVGRHIYRLPIDTGSSDTDG